MEDAPSSCVVCIVMLPSGVPPSLVPPLVPVVGGGGGGCGGANEGDDMTSFPLLQSVPDFPCCKASCFGGGGGAGGFRDGLAATGGGTRDLSAPGGGGGAGIPLLICAMRL